MGVGIIMYDMLMKKAPKIKVTLLGSIPTPSKASMSSRRQAKRICHPDAECSEAEGSHQSPEDPLWISDVSSFYQLQ